MCYQCNRIKHEHLWHNDAPCVHFGRCSVCTCVRVYDAVRTSAKSLWKLDLLNEKRIEKNQTPSNAYDANVRYRTTKFAQSKIRIEFFFFILQAHPLHLSFLLYAMATVVSSVYVMAKITWGIFPTITWTVAVAATHSSFIIRCCVGREAKKRKKIRGYFYNVLMFPLWFGIFGVPVAAKGDITRLLFLPFFFLVFFALHLSFRFFLCFCRLICGYVFVVFLIKPNKFVWDSKKRSAICRRQKSFV